MKNVNAADARLRSPWSLQSPLSSRPASAITIRLCDNHNASGSKYGWCAVYGLYSEAAPRDDLEQRACAAKCGPYKANAQEHPSPAAARARARRHSHTRIGLPPVMGH